MAWKSLGEFNGDKRDSLYNVLDREETEDSDSSKSNAAVNNGKQRDGYGIVVAIV